MTEFAGMALLITFVVVVTGGVLATVIEVTVRAGAHPHVLRRRRRHTRRRGSPRG
jgi:hypothetical protein